MNMSRRFVHAAALMRAEDHGMRRSCCVENGVKILHSRLQRRELAAMIGDPRASLVEQDQPKRSGEPHIEVPPQRIVPAASEIGNEVWHVYEVEVAVSDYLVGDGHSTVSGIANLGATRPSSPSTNRHTGILYLSQVPDKRVPSVCISGVWAILVGEPPPADKNACETASSLTMNSSRTPCVDLGASGDNSRTRAGESCIA